MGTEVSSEDGRRQPASGRQQRSPGPAWGQAKEKATEAGERLDGARAERGGAAPSRADGDREEALLSRYRPVLLPTQATANRTGNRRE